MLKFWIHQYSLQPMFRFGSIAKQAPRVGCLMKIQWPDGLIGYSDLHPWPELGDAELKDQLFALKKGRISWLIEQSIWLAHRDAKARAEKKSGFLNLPRVKNHFLISDSTRIEDVTLEEAKKDGFDTFKLKVGFDLHEELKWIERTLKQHKVMLRLDCNSKLEFPEYMHFVRSLPTAIRARIEYVEDPFPYHPDNWAEANALVPLALDHEYDKVKWEKLPIQAPFKVVIVKPARQDVKKAVEWMDKKGLKMVVTSALDHPVGMVHAAWVAAELKKFYPNKLLECGCLSLNSYRREEFGANMNVQGCYILDVKGHGIGFDPIFAKITWTPLAELEL